MRLTPRQSERNRVYRSSRNMKSKAKRKYDNNNKMLIIWYLFNKMSMNARRTSISHLNHNIYALHGARLSVVVILLFIILRFSLSLSLFFIFTNAHRHRSDKPPSLSTDRDPNFEHIQNAQVFASHSEM